MDHIITSTIRKTGFQESAVRKIIELFNEGCTIPFIARYRKEVTGNMDEVGLRNIRDTFDYCTELEDRRLSILKSIDTQGKLTDELKNKILSADTKQILEDHYLPYKPKRKTRDLIARELGLEPVSNAILQQEDYQTVINRVVTEKPELNKEQCLKGALDIIAAQIAENSEISGKIRNSSLKSCTIISKVKPEFEKQNSKFMNYYDSARPLGSIPAHALLAMRRGEKAGILKLTLELPDEENFSIIREIIIPTGHKHSDLMNQAAEDAYNRLIKTRTEVELRMFSKQKADTDSIEIFSENLKNLLLAPYGGEKWVVGADPGFRSGSKLTVMDPTGTLVKYVTIYPVEPQLKTEEAETILNTLLSEFPVEFFCIGNGTASRELFDFISEYLYKFGHHHIIPLMVNESGASVYSASEISRKEFPDLDLTYRGSVSIARRFQDPLAELVKIDPQSIGIGQYQHDTDGKKLKTALFDVTEHCVNFVGVNLNTASGPLLSYVSGLSDNVAEAIIEYRKSNGRYESRHELLNVPRLGAKTFEQCAGFLRIPDGVNPLDDSAVHPESYGIIEKMAADIGKTPAELQTQKELLDKITPANYITESVGAYTVNDIINELKKTGRDPRSQFVYANFAKNIKTIEDLQTGMVLEGVITNITNFGAFVDIGIHRDGLIHLSEMSDRYIKDPTEICKVNQIVKVKVTGIDKERGRISLSMKLESKSSTGSDDKNKKQSFDAKREIKSENPNRDKENKKKSFKEKSPEDLSVSERKNAKKSYQFDSLQDFQKQFNARFNRD